MTATDFVGNADPMPASRSFTVDLPGDGGAGDGDDGDDVGDDQPAEFGSSLRVGVKKKVRVNRRGRLTFRVRNRNEFPVISKLIAKTAGRVRIAGVAARKRRVRLGARKRTVPAGTTRKLRFRASKRGRRAIKANRRLKLKIVLKLEDPGGNKRRKVVKRRVKRPKRFRV